VNIPGITAQHAIITDTCRENRGDCAALEEAFARLRRAYYDALPHQRPGTKFHVVLSIERPQE
jgi:hypothetical protein